MDKITRTMTFSMITNVLLSLIKIIGGIIGKSGALIADGIHSFSDLSTDIVAVIGNMLAKKPADEKHPYGHGKIEYITSIVISLLILILGFSIIYGATKKSIIVPSILVAIISIITIFIKFLLSEYIIKKGKEYKNNILLASGYESRSDVISSIVVLISVLLMQLSDKIAILKYADMIATIIVGIFIIKIGFDVLKENVSIILEEQVTDNEYINQIKELILEKNNIRRIDNLMILKYGSYYKLIAEVSVDPELSIREAHQYIHEAENRIRTFDSKVEYVTIHINPDEKYRLIKAKENDIKQIENYRLFTKLTEDRYCLEEQLQSYYMIVVEGKKIGTVGYHLNDEKTVSIELLYIEEEYRNCKIGTAILKDIIDSNPSKNIILWVYKNNLLAISLYKKLGFKKIEETDSRYRMGMIRI